MTSFALQLLRLYGFSAVAQFFRSETCVCRVSWSAYVHSRHLRFSPLDKKDHFTEYIFTCEIRQQNIVAKFENTKMFHLIRWLSFSRFLLLLSFEVKIFFWRKHQSKSEMCSTYLKKKRRENKKGIVTWSKSKYSIRFTVVVNIATAAAATVRKIFSGYFFSSSTSFPYLFLLLHFFFPPLIFYRIHN